MEFRKLGTSSMILKFEFVVTSYRKNAEVYTSVAIRLIYNYSLIFVTAWIDSKNWIARDPRTRDVRCWDCIVLINRTRTRKITSYGNSVITWQFIYFILLIIRINTKWFTLKNSSKRIMITVRLYHSILQWMRLLPKNNLWFSRRQNLRF